MSDNLKMSGEERKRSIVEAARALFAQKGFDGTSIKDIARAAGVSTPLLYFYFPSKEALYDEALEYARVVLGDTWPVLENQGPGTPALVALVYDLLRTILFEVPGYATDQKSFEKLLFRSLIGDTTFAEKHFQRMERFLNNEFTVSCFKGAREAGDLVENPPAAGDALWFMHSVAMALNLCHLSGRPTFPYEGSKEQMFERAVLFCLRGMGLTEEAIRTYYQPERLRELAQRVRGRSATSLVSS